MIDISELNWKPARDLYNYDGKIENLVFRIQGYNPVYRATDVQIDFDEPICTYWDRHLDQVIPNPDQKGHIYLTGDEIPVIAENGRVRGEINPYHLYKTKYDIGCVHYAVVGEEKETPKMISTIQRAEGCVDLQLDNYNDIPLLFEKLTRDNDEAPDMVIVRAKWGDPSSCVVGVRRKILTDRFDEIYPIFCGEHFECGWGFSALAVTPGGISAGTFSDMKYSYRFCKIEYNELEILSEWRSVRKWLNPGIDSVIDQLEAKGRSLFIVTDTYAKTDTLVISSKVLQDLRRSETLSSDLQDFLANYLIPPKNGEKYRRAVIPKAVNSRELMSEVSLTLLGDIDTPEGFQIII